MSDQNDVIRRYYQSKSLSEERLERILSLASPGPSAWKAPWGGLLPVALALLVVFGAVFAFVEYQRRSFAQRVVAEIAMNHRKQLDVEFATGKYWELSSMMDRLDFSILPARALFSSDYDLLGGRYCSIQGALAAQLKIRNKESGEIHTLYITKLSDALRSLGSRTAVHSGVRIELLSTEDLFLGIAGGSGLR